MATTELLTDPGHVRADLRAMTKAVKRSIMNPEIPIPAGVTKAMAKVAGTILLKGKHREQLAAGRLLLSFMEYNKSLTDPVPQYNTQINVESTDDSRSRMAAIAAKLGAIGFAQDDPSREQSSSDGTTEGG